ncbi:phosphinothricin acetyltransferase [Curtobacterium oceanosedimentum]|uniref:Phosphinothricin acetyltransferase n=2 Tax=Curtobacterium oceanosedimentum TaxID=465820 RepID=A0A147DRZ7_9MICO|nr:GNAT family N-acetyltransferase [Curtobacterium oceanosedimentum]KTR52586.1 phosphinothricin acetyltransferase [Curtobacterium oceanosedimentum]
MTDPTVAVRPMTAGDWPAVEAIYREGIATGNATFEAEPPTWEAFNGGKLPDHRFVALGGDVVLGWVAVSPTSARPVYRGVVEHSVYVAAAARGRGIGHLLLDAMIASTEAAGIWTIQSGIFPENTASRALHTHHGFRELGTRERIGLMTFGPWAGQWRDNVLVERRSPQL